MTIDINIKLQTLKGTRFVVTDKGKRVIAGMLHAIYTTYGNIDKENISKFVLRELKRKQTEEEKVALYWLNMISKRARPEVISIKVR